MFTLYKFLTHEGPEKLAYSILSSFSAHPFINSGHFFYSTIYVGFGGTRYRNAGDCFCRDQRIAAFAIPLVELMQTGGPAPQRQEAPPIYATGSKRDRVRKTKN